MFIFSSSYHSKYRERIDIQKNFFDQAAKRGFLKMGQITKKKGTSLEDNSGDISANFLP